MRNDAFRKESFAVGELLRSKGRIDEFQGKWGAMYDSKSCDRDGCTQAVVTAFRAENFCLEHFCSRCYQLLERIDQRDSKDTITVEHALLADECARRVIDICMRADILNNLDRARLLDILLWCGDISAAFPPGSPAEATPAFRAPYEKPELRRSNAKTAFSE